jgi:transcriptional regulator with XRE-family HTH domain
MNNDPTLGHVVAEKRKKLNLSQKELAAKILREDGEPISPQYLNDIERNRRAPTSDHMVGQFALVLDLNADYLHYLNGRFPEAERKERLTENEFSERMIAFRRDTKSQIGSKS